MRTHGGCVGVLLVCCWCAAGVLLVCCTGRMWLSHVAFSHVALSRIPSSWSLKKKLPLRSSSESSSEPSPSGRCTSRASGGPLLVSLSVALCPACSTTARARSAAAIAAAERGRRRGAERHACSLTRAAIRSLSWMRAEAEGGRDMCVAVRMWRTQRHSTDARDAQGTDGSANRTVQVAVTSRLFAAVTNAAFSSDKRPPPPRRHHSSDSTAPAEGFRCSCAAAAGRAARPAAMTSCKEAIKDVEVDGAVATEMEEVRLCPIALMKPLIVKMDNSLSTLKKCKQLRMSSNAIQKIEGLAGCDSLQILSLGRNALKKIEGLNDISDTRERADLLEPNGPQAQRMWLRPRWRPRGVPPRPHNPRELRGRSQQAHHAADRAGSRRAGKGRRGRRGGQR